MHIQCIEKILALSVGIICYLQIEKRNTARLDAKEGVNVKQVM
jgi:hypothetical protein